MNSAARSRWILATVLVAVVSVALLKRHKTPQSHPAYIADQAATLWNTTAQVRQPVATLGYGEKVAVLRRVGDEVEVRTDDGAHGWLDARLLIKPELWQRAADVLAQARTLPVQATGHTRTISNVHLDPGRDTPRIFQFGRDVPVLVLDRRTLPVPLQTGTPGAEGAAPAEFASPADEKSSTEEKPEPKREDWLFVSRAEAPPATGTATLASTSVASAAPIPDMGPEAPVAGWILARFVELTPPTPIPDYATSAGIRVVAWAVLNTQQQSYGDKPQYVVAGIHGGEGQPCDFTLLRVYTWGEKRQQYETAYVENNFCGQMPIRVQQTSSGPEFRFPQSGQNDRVYRMRQTIVRRVDAAGSARGKRR